MDYIITENQLGRILNEESTEKKSNLEKVLNKYMPKDFSWWKKIEIDSLVETNKPDSIILIGTLYVDYNWAVESFNNLEHNSHNFELKYNKLLLGELYFADVIEDIHLYRNIAKKIKELCFITVGINSKLIMIGNILVKLI